MNTSDTIRKDLCDIARFSFSIVNDLLSRDQRLARGLRSDTTGSHQIIREETITEDLITKLLDRFPQHIEVILFTHSEETQTGADWYWRIEQGDHAIHARVQAKRVQRREFGAPDNDGFIRIDLEQLGRLLVATRVAAEQLTGLKAWLATYARFDATPPCGCFNLQDCTMHRHEDTCDYLFQRPSLWIGNAQDFKDINSSQVPVRDVIENSLRLDCLLPCIESVENRSLQGPSRKGFFLRTGIPSFRECVEIIQDDVQLRYGFRGALRIY